MDDLLDLDWDASSSVKPPARPADSAPSFDLLSSTARSFNTPSPSLTQQQQQHRPPNTGAHRTPVSHAPNYYSSSQQPQSSATQAAAPPSESADAFSSLLSFSTSSSANLSMAERQKALSEEAKRKAEREKNELEALYGGTSGGSFWDSMGGTNGASQTPGSALPPNPSRPAKSLQPVKPQSSPLDSPSYPTQNLATFSSEGTGGQLAVAEGDLFGSEAPVTTASVSTPSLVSASGQLEVAEGDLFGSEAPITTAAVSTTSSASATGQAEREKNELDALYGGSSAGTFWDSMGSTDDALPEPDSSLPSKPSRPAKSSQPMKPQSSPHPLLPPRRLATSSSKRAGHQRTAPEDDAFGSETLVTTGTASTSSSTSAGGKLAARMGDLFGSKGSMTTAAVSKSLSKGANGLLAAVEGYVGGYMGDFFGSKDSVPEAAESSSRAATPSKRRPYVSSARHRVPQRTGTPSASASQPAVSPSSPEPSPLESSLLEPSMLEPSPPEPSPPTPPLPMLQRQLVAASPSALSASLSLKEKGNAAFKLGSYADAEVAYTSAINALPDGHLRLVTLFNNRANARLKNGDHSGAAADASAALGIIVIAPESSAEQPTWNEKDEAPLPSGAEYEDLSLRDAYVKALSRRAMAREMSEKWSQAAEDWQRLLDSEREAGRAAGAGARGAREGKARCDKMLGTGGASACLPPFSSSSSAAAAAAATSSRPRPQARPPARRPDQPASTDSSEAVSALRATAAAADAEDNQRLSLKDGVDAKVSAWTAGKEGNLRALIASFDSVAWEGLGWKKVGMHELVTDKQLKVQYTKAISRLHPDKLKSSNTSLEQRMVAAAAFSVLNDAWNAQK